MAPIVNQLCRHCGRPAVEGRVDLDGSVTYCCEEHVETPSPPPEPSKTEAPKKYDRTG